jgi:hypothetical protein
MRTATLALILAVAWRPLTAQQATAIPPSRPASTSSPERAAESATRVQAAEAPDSGKVRLSATAVD